MRYFKVLPACDQMVLYTEIDGHLYHYMTLFANELFTEKEFKKIQEKVGFYACNFVEEIELKKSQIYWFFGARYPIHEIQEQWE